MDGSGECRVTVAGPAAVGGRPRVAAGRGVVSGSTAPRAAGAFSSRAGPPPPAAAARLARSQVRVGTANPPQRGGGVYTDYLLVVNVLAFFEIFRTLFYNATILFYCILK